MKRIDHGSANMYVNYGCRCDKCRAGNTARAARSRAERVKKLAAGWCLVRHGVYSTYINYGCRCDQCTAANTAATRLYRQRRASS